MKICAIDPGETTGLVVFDSDTSTIIHAQAIKLNHLDLYDGLINEAPDLIVYERFSLYSHKAESLIHNEFYTVQLIGVIQLYCQLFNIIPVIQTAAQAKSIWSDDKLKQYPQYWTNSRHSRDATRHVLHYLQIHKQSTIKVTWDKEYA